MGLHSPRRQGFQNSLVSVWGSWLGEAPGFPHCSPNQPHPPRAVGMADWFAWWNLCRRTLAPLKPAEKNFSRQRRVLLVTCPFTCVAAGCSWRSGPRGWRESDRKKSTIAWLDVHAAVLADHSRLPEAADEDDLDTVSLSFPVWLKHRISSEFCALCSGQETHYRGRCSLCCDGAPGMHNWHEMHGRPSSVRKSQFLTESRRRSTRTIPPQDGFH